MNKIHRRSVTALAFLLTASQAHAESKEPGVAGRPFHCLMEARVIVKLGSSVTGLISEVTVDRGDTVKAGQIVARLDSGVQEAVVSVTKTRATNEFPMRFHRTEKDYLNKKLNRVQGLQQNNIATLSTLEEAAVAASRSEHSEREAELNLKVAQLELKREEAALDQRVIRSPVDGVVTERALFSGEYRNESNHLMTIAQIDPLNVEVVLPIKFYGQLKIGSKADILPEDPVGGVYAAEVVVIDRVLDAASGTFGVRLQLANPDNKLPAGIRCSVKFH